MSLNDNGLNAASWTVVNHHHQISEGAIVGISFGWIIGVIGLYILGMCIIWKRCPSHTEESSEDTQRYQS